MKKFLSIAALSCIMALGFTSCNDDDDTHYDPILVTVTEGAYIINTGNQASKIDGSITLLNYATTESKQNVYKTVNNKSLGGTVNDAVAYGSKIYIVGSDESTIFVADKLTLKEQKTIKTEVDGSAATPRHIVAANGKVYVSTYSGKVLAIDTLSCSVTNTYDCGSYSEGMAVKGDSLFVADSDYGSGNSSISFINLKTGTTTTIKNDKTTNVTDVMLIDNNLYFLDQGYYDYADNYKQKGQGVYMIDKNNKVTLVKEATMWAYYNGVLYTINNPYGSNSPKFEATNLISGKSGTFIDGNDIASPCAISIDPVFGYVFITSYNLKTGYADYSADGYCVIYDYTGNRMKRFDTGVGPCSVAFIPMQRYIVM